MALYSPTHTDEDLDRLITEIKDWQLTHGSLLKLVRTEEDHTVLARPIGVSVFPTPFPKPHFEQASNLAPILNKLYASVAEDSAWLYDALHDLLDHDTFIASLWHIHQQVQQEGPAHPCTLGIFRSDYMLHSPADDTPLSSTQLKQVEFNTFSVAGGAHATTVSAMHQYLLLTGAYGPGPSPCPAPPPPNATVPGIVRALSQAHVAYTEVFPPKRRTCILILVQPANLNIADERPLEYSLWSLTPPIRTYRLPFPSSVLSTCALGPARELLFTPPSPPNTSLFGPPETLEVSTVYYRAGYDAAEYDDTGTSARLLLERARAVKCPSVGAHLATLKRVQQRLGSREALARWLETGEVEAVERVGVRMLDADEDREAWGRVARAGDGEEAGKWVLKPNREGGGHNVYGGDIPGFLREVPRERWGDYVLMRKIEPPAVENCLISPAGLHRGAVVSELGIFGACLWRKFDGAQKAPELLVNEQIGWSFKTKNASVDEMSVVKGFGCFDSPLLVPT